MKKTKNEISQSLPMLIFIILSGGLQDAYSYFCRDGVFANAQTGNIVFLSVNIVNGDAGGVVKYLVPVTFFALGAIIAKTLFFVLKKNEVVFWKQIALITESVVLLAVAFMPQSMNLYANALTSFACAVQVLTFDQIYGNDFASTMCIGNMRSGTESFCEFVRTGNKAALHKAATYFSVILVFAVGAGIGSAAVATLGDRSILICCASLAVSFFMMFREKV